MAFENPASRWRRVCARAVDYLIALVPTALLVFPAIPFAERLLAHEAGKAVVGAVRAAEVPEVETVTTEAVTWLGTAFSLVLLVLTVLSLTTLCLYDWLAHTVFRRTLGKALFGIRVVSGADGRRPGVFRCFARTAVLFGLPGIAVCWAWIVGAAGAVPVVMAVSTAGLLLALGPSRRTLHDRLSGTRVARR